VNKLLLLCIIVFVQLITSVCNFSGGYAVVCFLQDNPEPFFVLAKSLCPGSFKVSIV